MIVLASSFSSSEFETIYVPNTSSFVRELVSPVFSMGGRNSGRRMFFTVGIIFILVCVCLICALQSNHSGQSAGCLGDGGGGCRALPCRGGERGDRGECVECCHLPERLR